VVPRADRELDGMVVDAEGRPVAGASVDICTEDTAGQELDFQARVFSNESGVITLSDLSEVAFQVRARHPTFGWARAGRIVPGAGRLRVRVFTGFLAGTWPFRSASDGVLAALAC
jgi:hypothetical protein